MSPMIDLPISPAPRIEASLRAFDDRTADPEAAATMASAQDALRTHFGQIWPVHNDAFCELLVSLRRHFDGDLDRMLVLAIIGSRHLARGRIDHMSYHQVISGKKPEKAPAPINVQSIADYSGIPRETVRRKVRDLEQSGWVERSDDGLLTVGHRAAQDLVPTTAATLQYLATIVTVCNEVTSR
jgi:DNA-binding MarR family transcriptional regulator